jgi:hypothetical protein
VCGGCGALWDLNASLRWAWEMEDQQRAAKVLLGCLRKLDARELASRKEDCFDEAKRRMDRRAEAHPRTGADGRIRKNRSTCMLVAPEQ